VRLDYLLHNTGVATAKDTFVVVYGDQVLSNAIATSSNWKNASSPRGHRALVAVQPLHPGSVFQLFETGFRAQVRQKASEPHPPRLEGLIPYFQPIVVTFDVFAETAAVHGPNLLYSGSVVLLS
jgi:hypothetical protein